MVELPISLATSVPEDARPAVERWWASLAAAQRQEAAELWDERREVCFFSPQPNDTGRVDAWEQIPSVEGGRFVPHDDSIRVHEWLDDWREYVLGHEEAIVLPGVAFLVRTFHICQVEPAAQAVVTSGLLPVAFRCPIDAEECPMHRAQRIAPEQTLHLTPAISGGWWVVASWSDRSKK